MIEQTKAWIAEIVIGLNLCPFARRVFDAGTIRYIATDVTREAELLEVLEGEMRHLLNSPRSEVETAFVIHPQVLTRFPDYNDFLAEVDRLLQRLGLEGVLQVASFHPHYQFAGTAPDAVENYTNRSPFPMLHLLREISITEVAAEPDVLLGIPERNIETMRKLGLATLRGSKFPTC